MKVGDVKKYQESPEMCKYRKTCIQHPLVCIVCTRRCNLRDCYKDKVE